MDVVYQDLYALDTQPRPPKWSILASTGGPPPRYNHGMGATSSGRLFVFGGLNDKGVSTNDLWEWNNGWTDRSDISGGPPRGRFAMGMAGCGNSVYIFGGFEGGIRKADLYRVSASSSLPAWTTVAASGTAPTARWVMVVSKYTLLFMRVCVYIYICMYIIICVCVSICLCMFKCTCINVNTFFACTCFACVYACMMSKYTYLESY